MNRLYIKKSGDPTGDGEGFYCLVTEAGEVLYDHFCSNRSFAVHDLIGDHRQDRREELNRRFGESNWSISEKQNNNDSIIEQMINDLKAKLANLPDCPACRQVTVLLMIHDPCHYHQQKVIDNISSEIDQLALCGGKAFYNIVRLEENKHE